MLRLKNSSASPASTSAPKTRTEQEIVLGASQDRPRPAQPPLDATKFTPSSQPRQVNLTSSPPPSSPLSGRSLVFDTPPSSQSSLADFTPKMPPSSQSSGVESTSETPPSSQSSGHGSISEIPASFQLLKAGVISSLPRDSLHQPNLTPLEEGSDALGPDTRAKCLLLAKAVPPGECRKCSHDRNLNGRHFTFHCPSRILRRPGVDAFAEFKKGIAFPAKAMCWLCWSPLEAQFHWPDRKGPERCKYPDVLKEYCYIIWDDVECRVEVFNRLGLPPPTTLESYKSYLRRRTGTGDVAALEVLSAYASVRL
ncbi:hypothetical protein C0991_012128 [Blastosporella zonata]|nr:hypothetical protein C0991_012128 [Blastosporella zonata]